jgi:hypothetical protein
MSLEHHYIYVPIGQTKKNEYCQYEYKTRDELVDDIKTLEARALALKIAHVPVQSYTLPIPQIQWNVLLAVNHKVQSAWKVAERRAITGKGAIVAKNYDMLRENVGYRLSVNEAAAASNRSNKPAGWTSKVGNDRSHQHGRLYNLSRPIHTVHTKSITAREEIQFASSMARRYARSFRSPSVESDSDASMRTASPPPEDAQDFRFADAEEMNTAIASTPSAQATVKDGDAHPAKYEHNTSTKSEDDCSTKDRTPSVRFILHDKNDTEDTECPDTPASPKAEPAETKASGPEATTTPAKSDDHIIKEPSDEKVTITKVPCDVDHSPVAQTAPKETATAAKTTEAPSHGVPTASSFTVLKVTPDLLAEVPEDKFPARVIPNASSSSASRSTSSYTTCSRRRQLAVAATNKAGALGFPLLRFLATLQPEQYECLIL